MSEMSGEITVTVDATGTVAVRLGAGPAAGAVQPNPGDPTWLAVDSDGRPVAVYVHEARHPASRPDGPLVGPAGSWGDISIRDHFAGMALAGLGQCIPHEDASPKYRAEIARSALLMADAMIAARQEVTRG